MIRSLLAVAILVLSMTAVLAEGEKDKQPPQQGNQTLDVKAYEKALIDLVNKERAKAKLSKLAPNPLLTKAALLHTENMARQEKMAHVLDGKGPAQRVEDAGYDYRKVSENLAKAASEDADTPPPLPAEIHKYWMESKKHRANILEPKFMEVGVNMGFSKKGTIFYTMVFGVRAK